MIQKTIKTSLNVVYSKPPKKNYPRNKTGVYLIDDIWSLNLLDLKDYNPSKNRGFKHVLDVIDHFTKIGWTVHLKNRVSQTIKHSFENILLFSKRKPNLIETYR